MLRKQDQNQRRQEEDPLQNHIIDAVKVRPRL